MVATEASRGLNVPPWPVLLVTKLLGQSDKFLGRSERQFMGWRDLNSSWRNKSLQPMMLPFRSIGKLYHRLPNLVACFLRSKRTCLWKQLAFSRSVLKMAAHFTRKHMCLRAKWAAMYVSVSPPLKGVETAPKFVSETFLRWIISPPHSGSETFGFQKHIKPECCSL